MARGRTLGLDFGGARCGVAIDDELGHMAHPRPFVPARDWKQLVAALVALAEEEGVTRFVVGLPLSMDGAEGRAAEKVRDFAQALADASDRDVILWDERLSTVEAARQLREAGKNARDAKSSIDGAAAATILQSFLDGERIAKSARARKKREELP